MEQPILNTFNQDDASQPLPMSVLRALSRKGREIEFPRRGILGQSAQARACQINASIGIALDDVGGPMYLDGLDNKVDLPPSEVFPYASSFGKPELRTRWLEMLREKNPSLDGTPVSTPVVTNALTHALSVAASLFIDPGDTLVLSDRFWGNYRLVFEHTYGAKFAHYETFEDGGYNVAGLGACMAQVEGDKVIVLLNFPNNPTGYTCTEAEADEIRDTLVRIAETGRTVVALIDDAYFGLVYEDGVMVESIFAKLADAHPNVLAVKVDGATKEDFAWGFRVGFLTFGFAGATEQALEVLEDKAAATVRATISNASHLAQSLLLGAYQNTDYGRWKAAAFNTLKARYLKIREVLSHNPEYLETYTPLPCNSGYFMCVEPIGADAEVVRNCLLREFDVGLIATKGLLRIAFSSVPTAALPELLSRVHAAVLQCRSAKT